VIFDLLNDNMLEKIDPNALVQYYPLSCIWKDIEIALEHNIPLINFFTQGIKTSQIIERFFPEKMNLIGPSGGEKSPLYDLKTIHYALYG
jgi:hypothetical protein